MSESVASEGSVARQMADLAMLAGANCGDFVHTLINSAVTFTGSSTKDLINLTVQDGSALIVTRIDVKTLFDTTDTTLIPANTAVSDLRSTDDFNPYGPFAAGSGGVGTIALFLNGLTVTGTAKDFGLINRPVLFIALSGDTLEINATPNQPAGKKLSLVTCVTSFTTRSKVAVEGIKKNNFQTIIISQ